MAEIDIQIKIMFTNCKNSCSFKISNAAFYNSEYFDRYLTSPDFHAQTNLCLIKI